MNLKQFSKCAVLSSHVREDPRPRHHSGYTRASGQQKRLWENCVQQFRDLCKAGAFPGPKRGMRNLDTKRGVRILNNKVYKAFDLRAFSGPHEE